MLFLSFSFALGSQLCCLFNGIWDGLLFLLLKEILDDIPCEKEAYIPPGVSFPFHLQLSPMKIKCTCNTIDSTCILDESLIEIR